MAFVVKCERCGNIQEEITLEVDRNLPFRIEDLRKNSRNRDQLVYTPMCDRVYVHLCDHCRHAFYAFLHNWPMEAERMLDKVVQEKTAADDDFRKKTTECNELIRSNKQLLKTKEDLENDIRILKKRLVEAQSK